MFLRFPETIIMRKTPSNDCCHFNPWALSNIIGSLQPSWRQVQHSLKTLDAVLIFKLALFTKISFTRYLKELQESNPSQPFIEQDLSIYPGIHGKRHAKLKLEAFLSSSYLNQNEFLDQNCKIELPLEAFSFASCIFQFWQGFAGPGSSNIDLPFEAVFPESV